MHAVRVITWNIGMADRLRRFVKTHEQAWRYLVGLSPDLAFLQETFPPDWVEGEGRVVHDPFGKWGSLIFSPTLAIEPFALPENSSLRALPKYLAFGEAPLPDGTQAIAASIHAPPRRAEGDILGGRDPVKLRRSVEGPKFNDAIFAGLAPLVEDRRFILVGDWNTARHQGTVRASRAGERFFARVHEARWYDCVWDTRQDEIRTWFGREASAGRLHLLRPIAGLVSGRGFSGRGAATDRHLSDHAPLIVDFDLGPTWLGGRSPRDTR